MAIILWGPERILLNPQSLVGSLRKPFDLTVANEYQIRKTSLSARNGTTPEIHHYRTLNTIWVRTQIKLKMKFEKK